MSVSRFRLLAFGMTGALVMASGAYGQSNVGDVASTVQEAQVPDAPQAFGDTGADLVYTPVTPCRIINTTSASAVPPGPIPAATTRSFRVTGSGFTTQGGAAGSCGVPVGATGAVINFVAVGPAGAGDLRYTPFGTAVPNASFLNYVASGIANDNTANGMTFPICNPATTVCTNDFTIQVDGSATNVVADVQGYFQKADLAAATPIGSSQLPATVLAASQFILSPTDVLLPRGGACLVTCEVDVESAVTTGPLFFRTAQRNMSTATNAADPSWGNDGTFPSTSTSGGKTHVWNMAAGITYRFGCFMGVGGDFIGKTVYSTVAWICR